MAMKRSARSDRPTMPYHWHVDRLPLLVFGPLAIAVVLLVIAMGIRQAVTRFRSRQTPEQIKVTYEAYLRRLLNPQPERSEEHTSELQSRLHLVCRLLLEKKK